MAEQTKRQQLEVHLANKAKSDPDFRERLLTDPKRTIEAEIGMRFPEGLQVTVYEERLNHLHVVLPIELQTADDLALGQTPRDSGSGPFWKAAK
jgi:hypothetical protein